MYDLSSLQMQLTALQNAAQQVVRPSYNYQPPASSAAPVTTQGGLTKEDVRGIVLEVLREELAPKPQSPLLKAVGSALNEADQVFLTNHIDKVEAELPMFLETDDGKFVTQTFVDYLKGKYDGNKA